MSHEQPDLGAGQRQQWQDTYRAHPNMYGSAPSAPAVYAAQVFKAASAERVASLGGRLEFVSRPGGGTIARAALPIPGAAPVVVTKPRFGT